MGRTPEGWPTRRAPRPPPPRPAPPPPPPPPGGEGIRWGGGEGFGDHGAVYAGGDGEAHGRGEREGAVAPAHGDDARDQVHFTRGDSTTIQEPIRHRGRHECYLGD